VKPRLLWAAAAALAAALPASAQTAFGGARFTMIAPELIRLEYQPAGKFIDEPSLFAVDRSVRFDGYREERGPGRLVIDTGRIRLVYVPDGKPFSPGNLSATVRNGGAESEWKPGMWSARDLGGARNLDGTKGPAPMEQGLLSRDGWRLLDDSSRPLLEDGWAAARPADAGLDWYLFGYGRDYKAGLRALTLISGPAPMPRKYVLGSWYSRWWPHSAKDYRRIVAEYKEHDFPLDVVALDMDWHLKEDWTGYTWNRTLFPDPEGFLRWVHQQGLFATLNDHIALNGKGGVRPFEERYAAFMRALGRDPAKKESLPYDAGSKGQMDAFFSTVYEPLEKQGVDFWWLDYWDDGKENPFNHPRWVNELYFRHSKRNGLRGQLYSRWADWGGQRHPIEFSGDSWILWPTLEFQVPFTANSGNAGAFFWAHDVGGYQGKRDGELLARWTQFAAFSAALRLHSMNDPKLDKRPWSYPEEIEDSMRTSFHLRSRLFPYTYSSVWRTHEQSLPLVRPLYLEYPDDERAYGNPQEYLYGDSFLVAPIVSSGAKHVAIQKVWFPEGAWYGLFDGARHEGPSEAEFSADLSSFPVFARGGVPIPMQPYTPRMGTAPLDTLIVRAYPGEDGKTGTFDLYEDDGVSDAYEKGAYALTRLEYRREAGQIVVSILPAKGSYRGQPAKRTLIIELPSLGRMKSAEVDGAARHAVDRTENISRFDLGPRDIRQAVTLKIRLD
jgi:alpha-glucosidase (family GH31 glycosyl hydrolase)